MRTGRRRHGDRQVALQEGHEGAPLLRQVRGPNGSGSWVLGSPAGGGVGHMPSQPGVGTITLVDNTTQHPPDPGDTCEATTPKSDCGTVPLLGPPLVGVTGDGKTQLVADLARVELRAQRRSGPAVKCSIGQARTFNDIFYSGRANEGKLAIPMASISAVDHRRVVRVSGSSHKVSGTTECARGDRLHRRRHPQGDASPSSGSRRSGNRLLRAGADGGGGRADGRAPRFRSRPAPGCRTRGSPTCRAR